MLDQLALATLIGADDETRPTVQLREPAIYRGIAAIADLLG